MMERLQLSIGLTYSSVGAITTLTTSKDMHVQNFSTTLLIKTLFIHHQLVV
jgi:hypothetical protein